jgi:ABC-type branched-subunit amino acid transport system substrate-binding protein
MASLVSAAIVIAACGSSAKTVPTTTTAASRTSTTAAYQDSTVAAVGVTATTVKVGVALVDFTCIQQFVDSIRVDQNKVYQAFIDDINTHGGLAGRQIVPVYRSYCPIGSAQALTLCNQFTEDDKVFAVMANFEDFSGDAQTCVAKDHNTILLTFDLTQAIMNESPPGLLIYPGTNPERVDAILADLLQKAHTLDGKKVAVLGETTSQNVVRSSVEPALKRLGVATGSTAILSVGGTDTSAAQAQLDSFIERWKTENVDALFVSGTQVSSQQFIEKVRQRMPNVLLITDINTVLTYGQEEHSTGRHPNPYEGIITANGPTSHEYDQSDNWTFCSTIYQQQTGKVPPNAEAVVPGPNGKSLDTYGSINDACQLLTLFHDIAVKVGRNLNLPNWVHTVDTYGPIRNAGGGQFASLHAGHYDIDDTFRLEAFDSSIGLKGDWRPLTPLQDISGS